MTERLIKNTDPVILTASGLYVAPLALQVLDIRTDDIAHALANQCRFSGHTRRFYSVAQHAVLVAALLEAAGEDTVTVLWGLLHDAAEAYLQDVARPLKEEPRFGQAYRGAEKRAERVIASAFFLPWPMPACVKVADTQMLAAERRDLMPPGGDWEVLHGVEVPEFTITPWSPSRARTMFLDRYYRLTKARKEEE